jgi:cytochrome c-type biogenesis protein CcmH
MLAAAPAGEDDSKTRAAAGSNAVLMMGLAITVPVLAIILYLSLGKPGVPDQPLAARQAEFQAQKIQEAQAARQNQDIENMVAQLAAKMEANPGEVEGWRLLARSYRNLERYQDAAAAYNRALQLTDRDPEILAAYGETLVLMGEGMVSAAARAVLQEVIDKGGDDPRALFYLGVASAQQGNIQAAMDQWVRLANASPADAPWLPELRQRIQAAAEELGAPPPASVPLPPMAAVPPAGAPGPSQADIAAAGQMSDQEQDAMIRSMVQRLADRLKDNPNDREGWIRLEGAYRVLGETAKADEIKARIEALQ